MYLVSGGGSFLGLNISKALAAAGEDVILTTRRRNDRAAQRVAEESGGKVTVEVLDLTNMYEIVDLMGRYDVKRVVHTATAHMYARTRAANFPSYQMLFNMLEASTSLGVERFVLCNSIVVYRGTEGPWHEDMSLHPEVRDAPPQALGPVPSFEVTLKRIMEALALDYGLPMAVWDQAPALGKPREKQLETVVLRYPAQVGPLYSSMYNPIANLVHGYVRNDPAMPDSRPLRPFVDISYGLDNAAAATAVARAPALKNRIYNVSTDIRVTARQVVEALYRVAPDARDILKIDPATLPDEPGNQYLDTSRIKADLGWSPRFDIDSMLADYIAWLRNNEY